MSIEKPRSKSKHIVLTSHPARSGLKPNPIVWGEADPLKAGRDRRYIDQRGSTECDRLPPLVPMVCTALWLWQAGSCSLTIGLT